MRDSASAREPNPQAAPVLCLAEEILSRLEKLQQRLDDIHSEALQGEKQLQQRPYDDTFI